MGREYPRNVAYSSPRSQRDDGEVSSKRVSGNPDEKLWSEAEMDENQRPELATYETNGEEVEPDGRRFGDLSVLIHAGEVRRQASLAYGREYFGGSGRVEGM